MEEQRKSKKQKMRHIEEFKIIVCLIWIGIQYNGEWKDDFMHGRSAFTLEDGLTVQVEFEQDRVCAWGDLHPRGERKNLINRRMEIGIKWEI